MSAKQLRKWRKRMGWTQEKAAFWIGCSVRHYQRYEAGTAEITKAVRNSTTLARLSHMKIEFERQRVANGELPK